MNQLLECPIAGLDTEFPEKVFVVKHPPTERYGCYCFDGVHGLACFSSEMGAFRFAEWIDLDQMSAEEVNFDEARDIAQNRPAQIVALMLLDDMDDPVIHYVR